MMKALVVEAPNEAKVKEVPIPVVKADEVLIKVENVGICGTDIHIYQGEFLSPYPLIPGHEFSGVIAAVGQDVQQLQVGDRVSADPSLFCGHCRYCLSLRGNHCENWGAIGVTVDGAMAEYVSVPVKNVVKIPDHMTFGEAAFIEPIACVVHALNRLQLQVGQSVLLFGAGAMGQQLIQSLIKVGASEVVVVDVSETKLKMAEQWGATKCILSKDIETALRKTNYPNGFDIVVDATGISAVVQQALQYMGPVATFLQFGVTKETDVIKLNTFDLYNKDWTLIGSMAINYTFLPALNWMKADRLNVAPLISRTISLEETISYFQGKTRQPEDLKVQIKL